MNQAAESFLGTHDFSGFARILDKNPCRTIFSIRVLEEEGVTILEVAAGSFLWHQVRYMAAALGEIGAGKADASSDRETSGRSRMWQSSACTGAGTGTVGYRLRSLILADGP